MELKYAPVLAIGIIISVLFVALCFIYKNKLKESSDGIKVANTELLLENKYYKRKIILYYILRGLLIVSLTVSIMSAFILLARPYYIKKIKKEQYNRDIMIVLDISSSVNDLNKKLVKELQDTVRSLSGERIGIVVFNTNPILLSPLTDDYEYTIEQLNNIDKAIRTSEGSYLSKKDLTEWLYWDKYLYSGTLVGNGERGSSLIGDGLLGGLFSFPEGDDRTKVIIFATDNDPNGDGYVNLQEACDYCRKSKVTVYGIGTKLMYTSDKEEMMKAVQSTGGKFYLEENASTFHNIVEDIEKKSASLIKGKTIIKQIETPEKYYALLVISFIAFLILSIVLKRANLLWIACQVAVAVLLVLAYMFVVLPAHLYATGPDLTVKKESNLNVLFVVDNTISMLANDMEDGKLRADKLKEDCSQIIEELDGAKFSVISFNNSATVLAPFSYNADHADSVIASLYPVEELYARGSSLNTPKEAMLDTLKSVGDDQKTAIFYISDGEITNDEELQSFKDLSQYVDGGAVLGYGTKEGGTMRIYNKWQEAYEEIMDETEWPYVQAVSRIDEKNLKKLAADLGIEYRNMSGSSDLSDVISNLKSKIVIDDVTAVPDENGTEYINPPKYYGYYVLIPVTLLILLNAAYVVKRK